MDGIVYLLNLKGFKCRVAQRLPSPIWLPFYVQTVARQIYRRFTKEVKRGT